MQEKPVIFPESTGADFHSYEINSVTMLKDLPVFVSPDNKQPVGVIKEGERIAFLGSDNNRWVKIQGESGIIGWFELQDNGDIVIDGKSCPVSEFFSYLCSAD